MRATHLPSICLTHWILIGFDHLNSSTLRTATPNPKHARLRLALLVLLAFSLGCSEFVVIGIESDLANGFGVSISTIGQLISLFALPYAVCTPLLALTTGRFKRYRLLPVYAALFCLSNLMSAVAQGYEMLLVARILIGSVSGALLAEGITFIPELVSPKRMSLVISIVYAAYSVAMVIVTSVGKIVADTIGWHYVMDGVFVLAILVCVAIAAVMPRSGETDEAASFAEQVRLFSEPSVIFGMLIFVFGVGSVYTFYGYITPYLEQILDMSTVETSTTLMVYGGFCLLSNILAGWIDTRFGIKALLVTFLMQAAVLFGLFVVQGSMPVALVLVFCLATLMYLSSVPCVSLFMRVARRRHPKALTLASSLEPMTFNVGISFGTAVGGWVAAQASIAHEGAMGAALALIAFALVLATIRCSQKQKTAPAV